MNPHEFLRSLTVVLCTAGVTTVVAQRLRLPVVLGYMLAGLVIGPHVPIPLVADAGIVHTLSELGVILLLFSLGLEFNLGKLLRLGPNAALTALIQSSIMIWIGYTLGQWFGWTATESVFTGAIIAISSTTIIAKVFDEQQVRGPLRDLVVGILIVEDLIAILLMATLTAIAAGSGLSPAAVASTSARLGGFLLALVAVGLLIVPRTVRAIRHLNRPETTLVSSIGICFAMALLADRAGYSMALGAFVAGSLVAESGGGHAIEVLVRPVRDLFAAVFFVSVGMLFDPSLVMRHLGAVAALSAVVIAGKLLSVSLGAFLTGNGLRLSVQSGMSLAQIGEFSFIIAGLGLSLGATREFLYPVAVAVSLVTTIATPLLVRASGPVANWIDRKLPKPLQTFASLYGSWIERIRITRPPAGDRVVRRLVRLLLLDTALLTALVIGTSIASARLTGWLMRELGWQRSTAFALLLTATASAAAPFLLGLLRVGQRLARTLGDTALPRSGGAGALDLGAAPRQTLVTTLQLLGVLLVGLPVLALTRPFLPAVPGAVALGLLLFLLGVSLWRKARSLHGHVRAGSEMIAELLLSQTQTQTQRGGAGTPARRSTDLSQVQQLLPGLGEPVTVRLDPGSPAIHHTLAELNLRGVTGATVLAIRRGDGGLIAPSATGLLQLGDELAVTGTREAVESACRLLAGSTSSGPPGGSGDGR